MVDPAAPDLDDPDADRRRHDLANVALALDALADAIESGVADEATAARLVRASGRRILAIRDR